MYTKFFALKRMAMLYLAMLFFIIAIVAGLLGFNEEESGSNKIAKFLFFAFISLAFLLLVATFIGLNIAL